ncbi:MAG: nucleotidyltransferase domain-containing protein, partial [Candidatus Bathyarchaeota archaeon]|nr:nucleotidyltransferase domain-containing protein [Candidatus Bathyarchaeota archaeon]
MKIIDPRLSEMREFAQRLSDRYQENEDIKAVLLFGSVATGNIHDKSDLDLVVIEDTAGEKTERNQYTEQGFTVDL